MFLLNLRCIVISLIILLRFIVLSEAEASYGAYKVKVINEFPHDPQAYTQGLLYAENNTLFESTGLYGRSSVRKVALLNGKVETLHEMQYSDFGEGLTLLGERIPVSYMIDTTSAKYACPPLLCMPSIKSSSFPDFNLDVACCNMKVLFKMFTHHMQDGWGLATDGEVLFGSDGTSTLYKIDPKTMKVIRKQVVKSQGHEVHYLNELEYVKDEVWANVYETDCIARISPKDGTVIGWILLQSLREDLTSKGYKDFEVLNGIAWDRDGDRIFVTGKLWPKIFEIKLLPLAPNAPLMGEINNLCIPKPFYLGKLES
ncbi:Glutaminyl-peptide cyclotransferase [Capsicum annuum]|nr:Glutaminyl-peptide cyclotransferase [Capsicum annuum]